MSESPAARAEGERCLAAFRAAGAVEVMPGILQPAGTLLDLYGEDIRARAYVTSDPLAGELMLRPDFTVPVALAHMEGGAEPARYGYLGPVFRRQERDEGRAREYLQAGMEIFAHGPPERAEAELMGLFDRLLAPLGLHRAIGDIGLLRDAVAALETTPARRAALMRHLWRPARFRALLERFAGRAPPPPGRARLLARIEAEGAAAVMDAAGPGIGARTGDEVAARLHRLAEDAAAPPLPGAQCDLVEALLAIAAPAPEAAGHIGALAHDWPALAPAAGRFVRRLDAFAAAGLDPAGLTFEASFGRTTMEYYDGFVFGFFAPERADLPPVASGGRYDALTRALGQGREIPAVGGVIRPGLVAALRGAS